MKQRNFENEIKGMFDGHLPGLIFRLASPIFVGMFFQLLYSIVDTIWVSRIDLNDPSYVGGVGLIFPLIFLTIAIASGILIGVSSLVARSIGEKNLYVLNCTAESGLLLGMIFSLLIIVIGYTFDEKIVRMLGGSGDYYVHGLEYFQFIIPAAAFAFMAGVFHGILQGEGLTDKIMKGMIIATVLNIILDPVFIFLLGMKVRGAAVATLISHLISGFYFIYIFLNKKSLLMIEWKFRNIDPGVIKQIVSVGFPQSAGQMTLALSFLVYNRLIVGIDRHALASFSICGRIDQFLIMPVTAVGFSLITIIGQNYGRGNYSRIRNVWKTALGFVFLLVIIFAGFLVYFAPSIFSFFTDVEKVMQYGVLQIRVVEFTFVFAAVSILATSTFQALAKPLPGLAITIMRLALLAIPMAYFYVYVLNLGILGVWLGIITGNFSAAVVSFLWVERELKKIAKGRKQG